jgi:ubiquinone/menaquinone biosynthesis C-methylase UbiE
VEVTQANINMDAAAAFSRQSKVFDELYSGNTIIQYKRIRVREHLLNYLRPNDSILELNSGTGEDAVFFARKGYRVHATDVAEGMQEMLRKKITAHDVEDLVSSELCSFTQLELLKSKGPYDAIFSNFAGLNCTGELDKVLHSLNGLLKPGGIVTMVIMPKFCLWETLLLFKGKFKTATRRLSRRKGTKAHIEGEYFKCWYYNPSYIIHNLKDEFDLLSCEGLCTIVPPSYMERFAEKHTAIYKWLSAAEARLKSSWPWKYIGDYYIITLQKKG